MLTKPIFIGEREFPVGTGHKARIIAWAERRRMCGALIEKLSLGIRAFRRMAISEIVCTRLTALGSQFFGTRIRPLNLLHWVPAKGVIGWMTEMSPC
jgi:hypothetical protein